MFWIYHPEVMYRSTSYKEKMNLAGFSEDPYCRIEMKQKGSGAVLAVKWTNWPTVSWLQYNYLILTAGVTHEQLKAYKGLVH